MMNKKYYVKPTLTDFGDVASITQGAGAIGHDGGGMDCDANTASDTNEMMADGSDPAAGGFCPTS